VVIFRYLKVKIFGKKLNTLSSQIYFGFVISPVKNPGIHIVMWPRGRTLRDCLLSAHAASSAGAATGSLKSKGWGQQARRGDWRLRASFKICLGELLQWNISQERGGSERDPACGTGSNLLSLFAFFADEMTIAALEDSTWWGHHLNFNRSLNCQRNSSRAKCTS